MRCISVIFNKILPPPPGLSAKPPRTETDGEGHRFVHTRGGGIDIGGDRDLAATKAGAERAARKHNSLDMRGHRS